MTVYKLTTVTSITDIPMFREFASTNFKRPRYPLGSPVISSKSHHYQFVGTTIDIAIKCLAQESSGHESNINTLFPHLQLDKNLSKMHLKDIKKLISFSLEVAAQETAYRSGFYDEEAFIFSKKDIERDVEELINAHINSGPKFKKAYFPQRLHYQNIIGDVDLIDDRTLIDIKTSVSKTIKRDDFNALVIYFLMAKATIFPDLEDMAFYFTRHQKIIRFNPIEVFGSKKYQPHDLLEKIIEQGEC